MHGIILHTHNLGLKKLQNVILKTLHPHKFGGSYASGLGLSPQTQKDNSDKSVLILGVFSLFLGSRTQLFSAGYKVLLFFFFSGYVVFSFWT